MAILIVDDSKIALHLIQRMLEETGYKDNEVAENAEEALQLLEGDPKRYDLVLMDINMPGMNGIQACTRLRSHEKLSRIPVIIMTAEEDLALMEDAFQAGANDFIHKPPQKIELQARIASLLALKKEIETRIRREEELLAAQTQLKELVKKLELLSSKDGLTDIPNRRFFDETLDQEWIRSSRSGAPVGLLMIDIDSFKKYNDCFGHLAGDDCLRKVGTALAQAQQRQHDIAARYGGEEFAVILPATKNQGVAEVAIRMIETISALKIPTPEGSAFPFLTISVGGVSLVPQFGQPRHILIEAADQAMYAAKRNGRNCFVQAPLDLDKGSS